MKKAAVLVLLCVASAAAAGEAVSGVNGKIGYLGGSMEGDWGNNVLGSAAVPLASNFGLQLDGLFTDVSHREFYGWGNHLFWRDSDTGLLGLTAAGIHEDNLHSLRGGLEGEWYADRFTFSAGAGVANLRYENGPYPFIDDDVTDFFAGVGVRYYPLEDLMVSTSYEHVFDNELVLGSLEYQTPVPGLSLFAQVARGENDYDHALFGVVFYFGGPQKSLMLRHRQDDPPSLAQDALHGVGLYGAEYNHRAKQYIREHPASQGTQHGGSYGVIMTMYDSPGMTPSEWWDYVHSGPNADVP
jgi:hypothetical protein